MTATRRRRPAEPPVAVRVWCEGHVRGPMPSRLTSTLPIGMPIPRHAARLAVMPLERAVGQAQFTRPAPPVPVGSPLELPMRCMKQKFQRPAAAEAPGPSSTDERAFLQAALPGTDGDHPAQSLMRARVRRGQVLLETTSHPVERIAAMVGFGSASAFRERFRAWSRRALWRTGARCGGDVSVAESGGVGAVVKTEPHAPRESHRVGAHGGERAHGASSGRQTAHGGGVG